MSRLILCGLTLMAASSTVAGQDMGPQTVEYSKLLVGSYKTDKGIRFDFRVLEDDYITVQSIDHQLCLNFLKHGDELKQIEGDFVKLEVSECSEDPQNARTWRLTFSKSSKELVIIYPPGVFLDDNVRPIELKRI